jgi:hypothetical protein
MAIGLRMFDFNKAFDAVDKPIILNGLSTLSASQRAMVNKQTQTIVTGESLSSLYKCSCVKLCGTSNEKEVCDECGTECLEPFSAGTSFDVWVKAPPGIVGLINPLLLNVLGTYLGTKDACALEFLLNAKAIANPASAITLGLIDMQVPRGLNNFILNFERILSTLILLKKRKLKKTGADSYHNEDIYKFCQMYKDIMFPQYVPMINKSISIIESTAMGKYIDAAAAKMKNVTNTLYAIDSPEFDYSIPKKENILGKTLIELAAIYKEGWGNIIGDKTAMLRKFVFGSRNNFTMRAVISSITAPHMYDELHLPWSSSVVMLRLHLTNKLLRRGYTPNEAATFLDSYTNKFHPLISTMFDELISESRDGCLYGIYIRNPTLSLKSIQLMRVTKIKKDPSDPTISMPIMNVNSFNAGMILIMRILCEVFTLDIKCLKMIKI